MRQVILRIQRIATLTLGVDSATAGQSAKKTWLGSLNILTLKVSLRLVETNVQLSWARSLNVPVLVGKFRFFYSFGAMKLGRSTYSEIAGYK